MFKYYFLIFICFVVPGSYMFATKENGLYIFLITFICALFLILITKNKDNPIIKNFVDKYL